MATSANMFATYELPTPLGTYTHSVENGNAVNLVRLEVLPNYSPIGLKRSVLYRLHISGTLLADTQAEISSKIATLNDVYSNNGGSWIYRQSDGTPTRHKLLRDHPQALTDVQVERRMWPDGSPAEYATGRVFSLVLQQEIAQVESQIYEFGETVRFTGDGGYMRRAVQFPTQPVFIQDVNVYTSVTCIQQGRVVAYDGWPDVYVPISYFPAYQTRADIRYIQPRFTGRKYEFYGIEWTYEHILPDQQRVVGATPNWGKYPGYWPQFLGDTTTY
jgi:hypothetical protein